eukprot:gene18953-22648_t
MAEPLDEKRFEELTQQLKGSAGGRDRLRLLKCALQETSITVEQGTAFMKLFGSTEECVKACAICGGCLTKEDDLEKLLATLRWPEEREEVKAMLGK